MDSEEAVSAFARAGERNGVLSAVHTYHVEKACRMIRPGDRVLDLGCGPANLLVSIAELNESTNFLGVDLSEGMIAKGLECVRASAIRNVELRIDDMTQLSSVEDGSVDVVLSSMALHHLPGTPALQQCFSAVERVMAPGAKVFISDFGRLKSLKTVEYFVNRDMPKDETVLEQDYRESLRAAFSKEEFSRSLSSTLKGSVSVYSTIISPFMIVLMTSFPGSLTGSANDRVRRLRKALPPDRRADLRQLSCFLRLGGVPWS